MNTLSIAVVGTGARAHSQLSTIVKLTDIYQLCAICDVDERRAKAAAKKYRAGGVYTNVERMLQSQKPDVVFVATPPDSHHVIAVTAMNYGASVITETPITTTLAMADAMIQACKVHGVKLEVAENVWRWPNERLKKKIVDAGLLGKITHVRLWYASGSYHGFNAVRTLVGSEAKRVLGYAGEVETLPYTDRRGAQKATMAWESGVIEFEDGVVCLYELPPKGVRGNFWEIEGTRGFLSGDELVLYKDGQRVRYQIQQVHVEVDGERVLDNVHVDTKPPIVWENPFKRYKLSEADEISRASILFGMYRAVTEGIETEYGAENARRDQELCIAVRESALRGSVWLDLPIKGLTELERRQHEEYKRLYGHDPTEEIEALSRMAFKRAGVFWTITKRL